MTRDPRILAWSDQFGALLRDKCRQVQLACVATGWKRLSHNFPDPDTEDWYELRYDEGEYWLTNLDVDPDDSIELDLEKLGVNR